MTEHTPTSRQFPTPPLAHPGYLGPLTDDQFWDIADHEEFPDGTQTLAQFVYVSESQIRIIDSAYLHSMEAEPPPFVPQPEGQLYYSAGHHLYPATPHRFGTRPGLLRVPRHLVGITSQVTGALLAVFIAYPAGPRPLLAGLGPASAPGPGAEKLQTHVE
ncbi:hypothetical protein LWF15_33430 [Kineosporia rhizophila]|uniref:hypothetical protein n=1 Tax=Kineosporia rhizophila TaxID=84633 RepID=UPI001E5A4E25|nr:hypothetical protein [Kineosporia rhizophila]MCE0540407.1 hypothetical protein [Kineosporia rhizophila]